MVGLTRRRAFSLRLNSAPAVLETLENRTLLSGAWTGIDADGDLLTVRLSGPGELAVTGGQNAGIDQIATTGTTAGSTLTVNVRMAGNGNGLVQVGEIITTDDGSLKAINAPRADMIGSGVLVNGTLRRLTLLDLSNGAGVQVGPAGLFEPTGVATAVNIGSISDASVLSFAGNVSSFRTNSLGAGTMMSAASVGQMKVVGDTAADVTTQGNVRAFVVGGVISGTWNIGGGVASIRAASTDPTFSATIAGSIGSIRLGAMNLASLTAGFVGSIRTGSLSGDITLTGNPDQMRQTLGTLRVSNVMQNAVLRIKGNVGTVSAGAMDSSSVLLGVLPAVTGMMPSDLPDNGVRFDDYFDGVFRLGRLTITGPKTAGAAPNGDFVNSNVFAAMIGRTQLRSVAIDNSGTPFGLVAEEFGSVTVRQSLQVNGRTVVQTFRLGHNWLPNPQDFTVQYAMAV